MNKKIAIIGTVGLPAKYGGFETLTEYLTKYLGSELDITVYCSSKAYDEKLHSYNGAKLSYIPLNANGIQSIPYDIISVTKALMYADTLLILGVSGCIVLPLVKIISHKRIIINIDGLEWKRNKWNKFAKWFLKYSEKLAVKYADIVVTDNKVIQDYVKNEYSKDSQMISYGADHVEAVSLSKELLKKYDFFQDRYACSVCRIEPENNIHIILAAAAKQEVIHLLIVGNWDASKYGIELRAKYSSYEFIHLLDAIYDQHLLNQIRSNCVLYIHGHSAGGTNPSLIEAMFLGLPIYAYSASYNKETTEYSALYFSNDEELLDLIISWDYSKINLIGEKMQKIAIRRYRWEIVTKQYFDLFFN